MKIEKSKLFLVLNRLSKREIKQFRQFVESPYFNQRTDLLRLLNTWEQHRGQVITEEKLYKTIYPSKKYSDQNLRLLMSYLFRLLEQFLVCQEVLSEQNSATKQRAKVRAYQRLQLPKLALKNLTDSNSDNIHNAEYYYEHFQKLNLKYEFSSIEKPSSDHGFQEISDTLDVAFIALKLRQSCLSLSHQAVYQSNFQSHFLTEIIAEVNRRKLYKIPAIGIYFYIYLTLSQTQANDSFQHLKTLLFQHHDAFPNKEIRDIYVMTINHCIRAMNQGEMNYLQEVLDIYKAGLQQEYLLENGVLSRFTYGNIVRIALKNKDLDWVENFIHDYKNSLERPFREPMFNFSLASLAYARKDYDAAAALLQHFNYRDVLLNLAAKTLLLKIYYEWQEHDLLDAHLDAMRSYIQRRKVIGYHRTNYLNIISYTKKLMQYNFYDKKVIKQLKLEIETEEILTEREWFGSMFFDFL